MNYSNIDKNLVEFLSTVPKYRKAMEDGKDIYSFAASEAIGVPYEECLEFNNGEYNIRGQERRKIAKRVIANLFYNDCKYCKDDMVKFLLNNIDLSEDALSKFGFDEEFSKLIPNGESKLGYYTELSNKVLEKNPEYIICSSGALPLFAYNKNFSREEYPSIDGSYIAGRFGNANLIVTPYYNYDLDYEFILCIRDGEVFYKFRVKN